MPQKVTHQHRIGSRVSRRVSELVFVRGKPKVILRWIDLAGVRTPIYADLDPSRLAPTPNARATYAYDGTTVDPADVEVRAPSPN